MSATEIKAGLYDNYEKAQDWQQELKKQVSHKALDIPADMPINVRNERNGMGWKELLAVGLLGMLGIGTGTGVLAGLGGLAYMMMQRPDQVAAPVADTETDTDTRYEFSISSGRKTGQ